MHYCLNLFIYVLLCEDFLRGTPRSFNPNSIGEGAKYTISLYKLNYSKTKCTLEYPFFTLLVNSVEII